ncbi:hypothetical protein PROH_08885 [Prochlorothrix hollandica PCC 9006 = CALU 1027]|uniref:Uncharacterized protein n=1 Tax=Prochlorothrix hollandica PCC 9006 = CALU 1027 TaxID=317619 RepID=A0A0M2PUW5_PROHO|nr:hypothetical protein PROH_08885 [Prochlorothrix hollandica PCC 9006 = CALU 1027]
MNRNGKIRGGYWGREGLGAHGRERMGGSAWEGTHGRERMAEKAGRGEMGGTIAPAAPAVVS